MSVIGVRSLLYWSEHSLIGIDSWLVSSEFVRNGLRSAYHVWICVHVCWNWLGCEKRPLGSQQNNVWDRNDSHLLMGFCKKLIIFGWNWINRSTWYSMKSRVFFSRLLLEYLAIRTAFDYKPHIGRIKRTKDGKEKALFVTNGRRSPRYR